VASASPSYLLQNIDIATASGQTAKLFIKRCADTVHDYDVCIYVCIYCNDNRDLQRISLLLDIHRTVLPGTDTTAEP
jgi:hypothetical protein